jgi:two-component system KDP operon response regulator KdpE
VNDKNINILVVDDEPAIRKFLHVTLKSQGYSVAEASTGKDGISSVSSHLPDVIILDLGLPDIDGVEITRMLRQWTNVPIIILSVRGEDNDKIAALDAGADDYLTKPFSVGELLARIRAALRRSGPTADEPVFTVGQLEIDFPRRLVKLNKNEVQLTPNEYNILRLLVANAGRVLTHHQLLTRVWGPGYQQDTHLLQVNISNIRRKIEPDPTQPTYIVTEPGVGYRLKSE